MEMEKKMDAHDYLRRPYARLVIPDADGSYFAEIVEFPGCFADGKTAAEALENLESVAIDWLNTIIAQGQDIPDPMDSNDFSGKLVLRMTKGLHKRAALWAGREGVSLNQFITTCLAEAVGERARQSFIFAQPQIQAAAKWMFQFVPAGNIVGTLTMPQVMQGFSLSETNQLVTGTGSALVSVPTAALQNRREREQQHG
jgi:predicted RNase H-like HicB family nuclease